MNKNTAYINQVGNEENITVSNQSGEYYDYSKTFTPERPYIFPYDKILTMKIFLAIPDGQGGSAVSINFEQALQKIIQTDNLTRGIPKIVYLVGWQYDGHDDKYPAWHEVNPALKRPQDETALESLLWLMEEAGKFNTVVSVHINMQDAYTDSPLWEDYIKNDLIAKNADGSYYQVGVWNNKPAYQVCFTKEVDSGFAQKRIDYIIDMLKLDSVGTVHFDAFFPRKSEYHGITQDMETRAMRKMYRYWRDRGIDLTSELQAYWRPDPFIGLQPMAWHFDLTREQRTMIHQNLACGGMTGIPWEEGYNSIEQQETGFLFGQSMQGEEIFSTENFIRDLKKQFCTTTLQTYYQNLHAYITYDENTKTTTYSEGLILNAGNWSVMENGRLLRANNDVFIPAAWREEKEILAFSENGYFSRTWVLPPEWKDVEVVDVFTVTENGLVLKAGNIPVSDLGITISIDAMEEVSIKPSL